MHLIRKLKSTQIFLILGGFKQQNFLQTLTLVLRIFFNKNVTFFFSSKTLNNWTQLQGIKKLSSTYESFIIYKLKSLSQIPFGKP